MSTSKLQREFSFALSTHFGGYTIRENSRPEWCLGDNYERLELDFWIVELDVAIEIQGDQHYVYTPHFHGSYEGFKAQQARDAAKKRRCKDYGVLFLTVDNTETFETAIDLLIRRSQHRAKFDQMHRANHWSRELTKLHKQYRALFKNRTSKNVNSFNHKAANYHRLLVSWLTEYGMGILEYADPKVIEDLFFYVQKARSILCQNRALLRRSQ